MTSLLPILRSRGWVGRPRTGFFDRFFEDFDLPSVFSENRDWMPKIDVSETESEFVVTAEVPGMTKDDMHITMTDGLLTLSGEKKHEHEDKKENYRHRLPASAHKVKLTIFDESVDSVDIHTFNEFVDHIDEIMISSAFRQLKLTKVLLSKRLKKIYLANSNGLNAKYNKTNFNLALSFALGNNRIEVSERFIRQSLAAVLTPGIIFNGPAGMFMFFAKGIMYLFDGQPKPFSDILYRILRKAIVFGLDLQ